MRANQRVALFAPSTAKFFEAEDLRRELKSEGFVQAWFFGDVAGADLAPESATLCVLAENAEKEAAG